MKSHDALGQTIPLPSRTSGESDEGETQMDVNVVQFLEPPIRSVPFVVPADGITPPAKYTVLYTTKPGAQRNRVTQRAFQDSQWVGNIVVLKHDYNNFKRFIDISNDAECTMLVDCVSRFRPL